MQLHSKSDAGELAEAFYQPVRAKIETPENIGKMLVIDLDTPEIRELMQSAMEVAKIPFDPTQPYQLIKESISEKQRPSRPTK